MNPLCPSRLAAHVDSIRELIAVPSLIEHALGLYAMRFPEDAPAIEKVLSFRKRVREEFDRLICEWESHFLTGLPTFASTDATAAVSRPVRSS